MFFVVLFFQGFIAASYGQGCEEPKILNSTSYGCPGGPEENSNSWCQVFLASNILTLDTDLRSGNDANYWLTEDRKTGGEQGFIMDLGCEKTVQGLSLRNVRNYHHHDRSTKKFRLLGSPNNNGPWKELIVADLEDSRKQDPPPIQNLTLDNSVIVRFVKFELLEYWGNLGGGLQYFKVMTANGGNVSVHLAADNKFKLFADNETIGMGDHPDQVYQYYVKSSSQLRVEAEDVDLDSGNNQPGIIFNRGIILSTSEGLVTDSNWRCIENEGTLPTDLSQWPSAEVFSDNHNGSEFKNRDEIHQNASWICAAKLPTGLYPSKVACVPPPQDLQQGVSQGCVDNSKKLKRNSCEAMFYGLGVCVDFSASANVNFATLATDFDLSYSSPSGYCGKDGCCHCLKKRTKELPSPPAKSGTTYTIYALGGDTANGTTEVVESLGSATTTYEALPAPRMGHSAFVCPGTPSILVCGGKGQNHGTETFKSCIASQEQGKKSTWVEHSNLSEPRVYASTVLMESGDVYILGGEFSPDTSDVLRLGSHSWAKGPKLEHPTYMACAADVNATSFVTIGGGVQENSIVMYNTVTSSWSTPWPKLAYGRRNHCCVRIHSNIVVAGGYHYGENKNTATTLIIDINTGRASDGPSMKEARSFFSMRGYGYESDKGVLVAIGGNVPQTQISNDYDEYDEYFDYYENDKDHATSGFSNTVEALNGSLSNLNSWTYIEEFKLSTGTGHFDTVVVKTA